MKKMLLVAALPLFADVAGYNASSQVVLPDRSKVFYMTADFLYWQAIEDNLEMGTVGDTTSSLDVINGSLIDLGFDYKPGFQVGTGITFPKDQWDFFSEYTYFRGTNSVSKGLNPGNTLISIYPAWQVPTVAQDTYFFGNEKWRLAIDLIDLELGRRYQVGKKLHMRPFIGLRAPFIRQLIDVDYRNAFANALLSTEVKALSHSWGIGPRAGVLLDYLFGSSFSLFGEVNGDMAYTQYTKLRFKQESFVLNQVQTNSRYQYRQSDFNALRFHLDFDLGLGFHKMLPSGKQQIDLSASYTFQAFFDQNMFRNFVNDQMLGKSNVSNGNLYMQGLSLSARLDF